MKEEGEQTWDPLLDADGGILDEDDLLLPLAHLLDRVDDLPQLVLRPVSCLCSVGSRGRVHS